MSIRQKIAGTVLKMCGWTVSKNVDFPEKCVICIAPHTSNWDFFFGCLGYSALGGTGKQFMIKKEWFFFPLNLFFKAIGGIPINRGKKTSTTDQMVEACNSSDHFHLGITPEATRKANKDWKMGFYYIAKKADIPIAVVSLDYKKKEGKILSLYIPTDNPEQDIANIKAMYQGVTACYPDQFVI